MSDKLEDRRRTHISGTVEVRWTIDLPHPRVDTETVQHVILDALRAEFGVRPRDNGPVFSLHCEATDDDIEIDEDDRQDPPEEFAPGLQWYVETAI